KGGSILRRGPGPIAPRKRGEMSLIARPGGVVPGRPAPRNRRRAVRPAGAQRAQGQPVAPSARSNPTPESPGAADTLQGVQRNDAGATPGSGRGCDAFSCCIAEFSDTPLHATIPPPEKQAGSLGLVRQFPTLRGNLPIAPP